MLIRPHEMVFPPVLRDLIIRFGPLSSVAETISARVHSTEGGGVSSLATHDQEQLERVRSWAKDSNDDVRRFAQQLIESLEASRLLHAAEEEDYRRRRAVR